MSKVKLTHEQATDLEGIKKRWGFDFVIHTKIHGDLADEYGSLKWLSPSQLAKAWFVDYEVEPQFKEGDTIVHNGKMFKHGSSEFIDYRGIRHATELEKKLFELGRTEPKLKEGDVIAHKNGFYYEVVNISEMETIASKKSLKEIGRVRDEISLKTANEELAIGSVKHIYPIETRIKVGDNQ